MKNIEELYGAFGPDVISEIRSTVAIHGSVIPLLEKLNLAVTSIPSSQHQAITNFIYSYGISTFLTIARQNLSAGDVEMLKAQKLLQMRDAVAKHHDEEDQPAPEHPARRKEDTQPMPPRVPAQRDPSGTGTGPAHAIIDVPGYKGPERRSGGERRVGQRDRRADLKVIYKNRRYGGWDRRKEVRRESDRAQTQNPAAKPKSS